MHALALRRRYSHAAAGQVALSKLWGWAPKLEETLGDLREKRVSQNVGAPVRLSRLDSPRGAFFVLDGYHRVVEAILRGERSIAFMIDEYVPRIERTGGAWTDKLAAKRNVVEFVAGARTG
jgi:hypothetical protein